jgi:hypothetical protein
MTTPLWTFDSGFVLPLFVADSPVAVGLIEEVLTFEGEGGRHPSIE